MEEGGEHRFLHRPQMRRARASVGGGGQGRGRWLISEEYVLSLQIGAIMCL